MTWIMRALKVIKERTIVIGTITISLSSGGKDFPVISDGS